MEESRHQTLRYGNSFALFCKKKFARLLCFSLILMTLAWDSVLVPTRLQQPVVLAGDSGPKKCPAPSQLPVLRTEHIKSGLN